MGRIIIAVNRRRQGHAGIIDDNIQPTQIIDNGFGSGGNGRIIAHIHRIGTRRGEPRRFNLADDFIARGLVQISNRNMRALARQQMRRSAPHAAGGTGYNGFASRHGTAQFNIIAHFCLPKSALTISRLCFTVQHPPCAKHAHLLCFQLILRGEENVHFTRPKPD